MIIDVGSITAPGFVGGRLCLDFANTMHGRLSASPRDELTDYKELVSWARRWGMIAAKEAGSFIKLASVRKGDAKSALERAKRLRDAVYLIFAAIADRRNLPEAPLSALKRELADALKHLQIKPRRRDCDWIWVGEDTALESILWPIAFSAANLLTSNELARVRVCAEESCTWMFLDTSKGRQRRWCDMKTCGNRAKFRRYYKRRQRVTPTKANRTIPDSPSTEARLRPLTAQSAL